MKRINKKRKNSSNTEEEEEYPSEYTNQISVKNNRILFHCSVSESSCFELIDALDQACKYVNDIYTIDEEKPSIVLHINSYGGDVHAALSVVEHIKSLNVNVTTICEGYVASAGVLLSLAGKRKIIRKHSYMLIHEISSSCWGKYTELKDEMKNNKRLMKDLINYMKEACNGKLPEENIDELLRHDISWGAKKCLKYGLVDEIK